MNLCLHKVHFLLSLQHPKTVGVAQLVRASVCGTEGRRFEPDYLPKKLQENLKLLLFYKCYKLV